MKWLRRSLFTLCSMFLLGFSVSASASLVRVPAVSFASNAAKHQSRPPLWLLGVAVRHNGFVTVHVYAGNLTQLTDPDTGITHYTYSGFGELALTTKANGDTLSYQYDALGRRTTDVSQANGQSSTRTWVYDLDAGHACGSSATGLAYGQLACRTAPGFAERYQYDSLARQSQAITQLTDKAGLAHNYTRQYAYDAYSRLLTSTWPNGNTSHWQYNLAGYPSGVEDAQQQWLYGINAQNAWNRPTDISLAGGAIQQTAASDSASGRPLSLATQASGTALQGDTWQWWSNGSMAGRSTLTASGNRTDAFSYDGLERLTQASASGAVTSTDTASYSTSGNLTSKTGITGSYNYGSSQPHAVVSAGGTTYGYDASGNMTQRGATNVTYNAIGQPLSFYHVTDEVTRFAYDSDHDRYYQWAKLSNGDTQETFYVGASYEEKITHHTGGSTSTEQYAYVNDTVLQVTTGTTTQTRYLLRNALHSVEAVLNSQGQVLERLSYDTWGKPDATPQYTTRSYTGQEYLPTLGLLHLNGRVYDPDLGRFLSADPLVQAPDFSQSYNRYSYVWNNPVSAWDPTGYASIQEGIDMRALTAAEMGNTWAVAGWSAVSAYWQVFGFESLSKTSDALAGGRSDYHWQDAAWTGVEVLTFGKGELLTMGVSKAAHVGAGIYTSFKGLGGIADQLDAAIPVLDDLVDEFSRVPKGLMDQMVLDAAKQGRGIKIIDNLGDPKFKGMEKWSYTEKSANGLRSEVHYVRDPNTGELMDFKFKHHADTGR